MNARVSRWLATRHPLRIEALSVLVLYALYEASRGLVDPERDVATQHAHEVIAIERSLHIFVEREVQHAAEAVPGLLGTFGVLYLTLHLSVTGGYLVWLHSRRPSAFPFVRTTLVLASGLALIGYAAFPTAPPRLADVGLADTISNDSVDLNHGLISSLYNPFAAVPSMHAGYAAIVGVTLVGLARRRSARALGAAYPLVVLVVIVATGNHFLLDAVIGVATSALAAAAAGLFMSRGAAVTGAVPAGGPATRPATLLIRPAAASGHPPRVNNQEKEPVNSGRPRTRSAQEELDQLVLRLKGLVHVRTLLERREASRAEIESHTAEIERLRTRLAMVVKTATADDGYSSAA